MGPRGKQLPRRHSAGVTARFQNPPPQTSAHWAVPLLYLSERTRAGSQRDIPGAPSSAPGEAKIQGRFEASCQGQLSIPELVPWRSRPNMQLSTPHPAQVPGHLPGP